MELLHFMYGRKLPSAASQENLVTLLDLATLAHEYEVSSCIDHCIQLLSKMSMTHESASLCLEMASHVSVTCNIESLVVAVTEFLITRYKDVTVHEEELCSLTSAAIEVIFSRDDIQVPSEDVVYDIIMKWAKTRFPKAEERLVFLGSCITRIVRFPYMSSEKLRDILTCNDLDPEFAKNVVQEALSFKLEPLSHRWAITKSSKEIEDRRFIKRDYTKCIYNFDLSLDQCKKLKEVGKVASGRFYLGKQSFCLDFVYSSKFSLGVYLKRLDSSPSEITVRCKFSAMKKHEMDF
ncbi:BTB/POZ domain-containing protein POB1 [Acorus calamus]|uniref:BTB/POZ domain-containing protein POB1 n=1 Tax=Acorus calamus TaxID=4465 RepID=A0AAV9C7C1_ACOCL|nr:BTB/POZ domain-containing protein POB1 [Acorus calamus]